MVCTWVEYFNNCPSENVEVGVMVFQKELKDYFETFNKNHKIQHNNIE